MTKPNMIGAGMKNAAIYCRVSTDDQEKEGTSLQTQLEACLGYCVGKNYEAAYQFSEAYSGLTLDRPRLNECMDLIRDGGGIDILLVYDLDRLSRDATHGVILREELDKYHVILESVTEDIDKTPLGKAITFLRGTFSQLEVEKIKERTMRGKRARLKEGRLPQGTGVGTYGYDWDKVVKIRVINVVEAKVVKRIFTMIIDGFSCFHIARELNREGIPTKTGKPWHPLTIRRIVMNPAYYGETIFNQTKRVGNKTELKPESEWVRLPDATPPIIDRETFDKAQKALKRRKSAPGNTKTKYLLRDHVFCPVCGKNVTGTLLNSKYRYYRCAGTKPTEARPAICCESYMKADWLEQVVWDAVSEAIKNPEVIMAALRAQIEDQKGSLAKENSIDIEIKNLNQKIKGYDGQEKRLVKLFGLGKINENAILDELNQVKVNKEDVQKRLAELEKSRKTLAELQQAEIKLNDFCEAIRQQIDCSSFETKCLALDALDVKVYATRDNVNIQGIIPLDLVTIAQTSA